MMMIWNRVSSFQEWTSCKKDFGLQWRIELEVIVDETKNRKV